MDGAAEYIDVNQDIASVNKVCEKDLILDEVNNQDLIFREITSNVNSSVTVVRRRSQRHYVSEFLLPDYTRVSVSRREINEETENNMQVTLWLSTGACLTKKELNWAVKMESLNGGVELSECNADDNEQDSVNGKQNPAGTPETPYMTIDECPNSLRLVDYLADDLWAVSLTVIDDSSSEELLHQLETSCRLEPDAYRMERLQKRRNIEVIVDAQKQPKVQLISLIRGNSGETDSIATYSTTVIGENEN